MLFQAGQDNELTNREKWGIGMKPITNNMQKYENYREQMTRLKKAMTNGFFLEAIFIEYAIMEDRLESVLRHSGKWKELRPGQNPPSLQKKKDTIAKMAEEKKGLARKYFSEDLLSAIITWKGDRNRLVHTLMKQSFHTENLKNLAEQGQTLLQELSGKVKSYSRAIDREIEKEAKGHA